MALACLAWAGCAVSRDVPYNEAEFAATSGHGSGVVSGHAYAVLGDGDVVDAAGEMVVVAPVTAYTTENVHRRFIRGENLHAADPRIDKYLRNTTADAHGNFSIGGIPPGDYYVESEANWTTSYQALDNDGIETTMLVDHHKFVFARISLKSGQQMRVTQWDQSSRVRDGFYAYGGTLSHPHHQLR
jgi:hypothetical protein